MMNGEGFIWIGHLEGWELGLKLFLLMHKAKLNQKQTKEFGTWK